MYLLTDEDKIYSIWYYSYLINIEEPDFQGLSELSIECEDGQIFVLGNYETGHNLWNNSLLYAIFGKVGFVCKWRVQYNSNSFNIFGTQIWKNTFWLCCIFVIWNCPSTSAGVILSHIKSINRRIKWR